jgi:hypothetical protein
VIGDPLSAREFFEEDAVGVRLVESARTLRRAVWAVRRSLGRGGRGLRHLGPAWRGAAALAALSLALAGCAAVPASERDPRDPWQRVNRATCSVDYRFYTDVGEPVARTYVRVVPGPIRGWVSNFFNNLSYPIVSAVCLAPRGGCRRI